MGDVEKMFNQVGVIEDDRDSLRFLWRGLNIKQPPEEYQMLVHVFGAVRFTLLRQLRLTKDG